MGRFRHAGPKPQTREAAILMLADGVEASVRSLTARDEPTIRAMVTRIIDERLADGQFEECDLTLRDVDRIRAAFVEQLLGMYHQRIAYPQNKVVELESRRAAAGRDEGRGA
jgi:membrane-associated HD superfamily phosphohydrolase